MSVEDEKGIKDLMGMLKNVKGSTISSILDKTNLSTKDKDDIFTIFDQFNGKGNSNTKQNAMEIIQKLFQQIKVQGEQEKLDKLLDKINKTTNLSDEDKKVVEELKKLSK